MPEMELSQEMSFIYLTGWEYHRRRKKSKRNWGFVNTPKLNCDYLVFISEKIDALDKTVSVYKVCDQYPIVPFTLL